MKKIIGVIAEYNPFHLGHRYQIEKIKELYPDSIIIAIISTNFTQRGDISLLNKWNKATICLNEGIDLVARALVKYYLNPKGTVIYNGEIAVGTYYNGNTISSVNKKYASDSNWANKVYNYMEYLYKKI